MKKFEDFLANISESGHMDLASAKRMLEIIEDEAEEILEELENMPAEDHLPSWWMNKLSRAKEAISSARDYLLYPQEDEPEDGMPTD